MTAVGLCLCVQPVILSNMMSLEPNAANDRRGPVADGYITVASPLQMNYSSLGYSVYALKHARTHTHVKIFVVIMFLAAFSLQASQKIPVQTEALHFPPSFQFPLMISTMLKFIPACFLISVSF